MNNIAFPGVLWYNKVMENFTLSLDELNKLPKNAIALLYLQMSESFSILSAQSQKIQNQNERLIRQIEDLQEQVAILTQQRFGKRTEVDKQILGQLSLSLEDINVLNEAEVLIENRYSIYYICLYRRSILVFIQKNIRKFSPKDIKDKRIMIDWENPKFCVNAE